MLRTIAFTVGAQLGMRNWRYRRYFGAMRESPPEPHLFTMHSQTAWLNTANFSNEFAVWVAQNYFVLQRVRSLAGSTPQVFPMSSQLGVLKTTSSQ